MNPSQPTAALIDERMEHLLRELRTAREHQERRHNDWNDNYELYRNKVRINRLTQRQAVNLPLMKETIKTILSKVDDPPQIDWKEKSSDDYKELIFKELWNETYKTKKLEWLDILDKKNVLLYGISTKFLNITDEGVDVDVLDVFDVVFDPLMDPLDVESARFIIRQNIFKSLREILADDRYTEKAKTQLKLWVDTPEAIIASQKNREEWEKKMERLEALGVDNKDFPHFAAGDVIVNLTEHYTNEWNTDTQDWERRVVTYADEWCVLMDEALSDLIGINDYPFVVWYEDPETNDIYPDGVADLVRTPNKVINVWYSQLIENRTLSNFRMHWYDATNEGYEPQTYEPGPGRMLPAPGNPKETIMPVDVSGLDESLTAIDFVTRIVERGTGAVAIDKGISESGSQTLGEIEILVGKAMERSITMQKFYRGSWYELCVKWAKLMHENPPKKVSLYRTGRSGKLYEKTFAPSDWKSKAGYEPIVTSTSEQEMNQVKTIQKFLFILQQFPNNTALRKIAQRRQLELIDFTPEELKEVMDEEERNQEMIESQMAMQQDMQSMIPQQTAPVPQQNGDELQALQELEGVLAQA